MGTEEFWIPAAVAALSSGAEYANTQQAAKKQDQAQAQSISDQAQIRQKATGLVNDQVQNIANSSPAPIANKATGEYVAQLRKNSAGSPGSGSALAPVAGASSRYQADTAKAQTTSQDYGDTLAGQMGQIDAAVRQRQNEGLSTNTLATGLNRLGAQSQTQSFVDQLRAAVAGQPNPWVSLGTGMLKSGATAAAGSGLFGASGAPVDATASDASLGFAPVTPLGGYSYNIPKSLLTVPK